MNQNGGCQLPQETFLGKPHTLNQEDSFNPILLFREQIWVIISVEVAGTLAITQQMSKLDHLGQSGGFRQQETQDSQFNPFRTANSENME